MNIKAPLNMFLGYGNAAVNIIKALDDIGVPISLFPLGGAQLTTDDGELLQRLVNERYEQFDANSPSLTIFHEFSFFDALQSKKEVVGYPFFELDEMDSVRKKSLSCVDRILVASQWAKDVIIDSGFNNVNVVPLGVDQSIFMPATAKKEPHAPYKFFTIGKIERRKCTELLPRIFSAAFKPHDNVELHIMCDSPLPQIRQQMPHFKQMCEGSQLGDKITIHPLMETDVKLANFIREMDCGIFMTRAEGWGLPILQTLSCRKQIIVTDYSAQTEFCNEKNSNLVNITQKEVANDGIWFDGSCGAWASIQEEQIEQCISHMRILYKDRIIYNDEGVKTAQKFNWGNTAKILYGHLFDN